MTQRTTMGYVFDDARMAEGYANARPAVHPRVIEKLPFRQPVDFALDLGCGAGISTAALAPLARERLGMDPSEAMVKAARRRVPDATFLAAAAEEIPIASRAVDLLSAAGSLNYVDLPRFFKEAERILRPAGKTVVYDFAPGRGDSLNAWFQDFSVRYPWPDFHGRPLNPAILGQLRSGFQLGAHETFSIAISMNQQTYVDYMMTETNVAAAIANGKSSEEIHDWCRQRLAPIFGSQSLEVLFSGYFACLQRGL